MRDVGLSLSSATRTDDYKAFGHRVPVTYRPDTADEQVCHEIFNNGVYNLPGYKWWPMVDIPANPKVIDIGGHIGCAALYFAHMLPGSVVISVEPEERNYHLLWRNTQHAGPSVVMPMQCAVASRRGWVDVTDPGEGTWGYRTSWSNSGSPQRSVARTMNELIGQSDPFLVKFDAEGAEAEVFAGDVSWLRRVPFLLIELHDGLLPGSGDAFREAAFDRENIGDGSVITSVRRDVWNSLAS